MDNMNFSAFEEKIPFTKKIVTSWERLKRYIKRGPWAVFSAVIAGISAVFFILGSAFMFGWSLRDYLSGSADAPLVLVIMMGALWAATIYLAVYATSLVGKFAVVMQKFASDNSFEFHPNIMVNESAGFAFTAQARKFARNGVTGQVNNLTFWLYEYRFFSGTGRYPYPNIFTVFLIHLNKEYPQATFINKKGRLKMLWPKTAIKQVESPWYDVPSLRLYTKDGQVDRRVSELLTEQRIQQILRISPKAEIEILGRSLRIFLPGKPAPDSEEAQKLFDFAKGLG